jgi:hypothetical protein
MNAPRRGTCKLCGDARFSSRAKPTMMERRFRNSAGVSRRPRPRRTLNLAMLAIIGQPLSLTVIKSGRRDSNPRHPAWEASALPTELRPQCRISRRIWDDPCSTDSNFRVRFRPLRRGRRFSVRKPGSSPPASAADFAFLIGEFCGPRLADGTDFRRSCSFRGHSCQSAPNPALAPWAGRELKPGDLLENVIKSETK